MKKMVLSIILFILVVSLFGCSDKIEPLENPESELFTIFYEGDHFEIYKRTEIDEDRYYPLIGFYVESDKGTTCTIGMYELENYIVLYEEEYYDVLSGARLKLYTGNDLIDFGINANCRDE